jgi:hypothetical protein
MTGHVLVQWNASDEVEDAEEERISSRDPVATAVRSASSTEDATGGAWAELVGSFFAEDKRAAGESLKSQANPSHDQRAQHAVFCWRMAPTVSTVVSAARRRGLRGAQAEGTGDAWGPRMLGPDEVRASVYVRT